MATKKKITSSTGGVHTDALPPSPIFRNTSRVESEKTVRHMNGKPIPDDLYELIPYGNTDEGIAERLAKPHASATITRDPLSKKMEQRRDELLEGMEPWQANDAMREVAERHAQPGERVRFLSKRKIDKDGLRGWKPKIVNGESPSVGTLIMATMPEERAVARNNFYVDKATSALVKVQEDFQEEHERLRSETGMSPRNPRSRLPDALEGLHEARGNTVLR